MTKIDLTGQVFGCWVVENRIKDVTRSRWMCVCSSCGLRKPVRTAHLRGGRSRSCLRCAKAGHRKGSIAVNERKRCSVCQRERSISDFYPNKRLVDGLSSACKSCQRTANIKSEYGISRLDIDEQSIRQQGKCPICSREFSSTIKPYIDHCHETGTFRGLLCSTCNTDAGKAEKDPARWERALRWGQGDWRLFTGKRP